MNKVNSNLYILWPRVCYFVAQKHEIQFNVTYEAHILAYWSRFVSFITEIFRFTWISQLPTFGGLYWTDFVVRSHKHASFDKHTNSVRNHYIMDR
jgi:hypothetical protein